jgi:uncharacterized protein (UPF0276 family)
MPRVGLSLMAEPDFRDAASPLLESDGDVEVVEWTLDNGWAARAQGRALPAWCVDTLARYAERDALYGHGFSLSPLSGTWTERHDIWLALLRREMRQRRYQHVSEHFCFVTAAGFAHSAPLPVPLTERTLRMGQERMRRLAEAAGTRVGLENLAIAFGKRDVLAQGQFLDELLAPVDGFVLLDLHNLYCQLHNFDMSADDLLASYPLARVTELHLSGGSWDRPECDPHGRRFRRDTHDDAVPEEVFELLPLALELCPNLEAVFFERIGGSMRPEDYPRFVADYQRIRSIVRDWRARRVSEPTEPRRIAAEPRHVER